MEENSYKGALPVREAAKYLGLSISTLNKLRCTGGGPAFLKLGRAVRYTPDDLQDWLDSRAFGARQKSRPSPHPVDEAGNEWLGGSTAVASKSIAPTRSPKSPPFWACTSIRLDDGLRLAFLPQTPSVRFLSMARSYARSSRRANQPSENVDQASSTA